MPGRNTIKIDVAESYYHVYARGLNKEKLFLDESDFVFFLSLLKRYLSSEPSLSGRGLVYESLSEHIQLHTYCLMENHFHLLLFQKTQGTMSSLMRRVMTSYSGYFNRKYQHRGPVFESRYKASRVISDDYFLHISRYIHLNPRNWKKYKYSSISHYLANYMSDWLQTESVLGMHSSISGYQQFLEDYEQKHQDLEYIKHQLANDER